MPASRKQNVSDAVRSITHAAVRRLTQENLRELERLFLKTLRLTHKSPRRPD